MTKHDENGMWSIVMFDLPVLTKAQRREATRFRKVLIDLGWSMDQYSVYVRYIPTGTSIAPEILALRKELPKNGKVEIVSVTDRQWSKAIRIVNDAEVEQPKAPSQLTIFG